MGKRGQCCAKPPKGGKPAGGGSPGGSFHSSDGSFRSHTSTSSGNLQWHKKGDTPPRHSSVSSSSSHGGSPVYHGHSMRLHSTNVKESPPYSPPAHHLSSSFKRPTSFVERPTRKTQSFTDSTKKGPAKGIKIKEHTFSKPHTPARVEGKGKGPALHKSPASSTSTSPGKTPPPRGAGSGSGSGSHHH